MSSQPIDYAAIAARYNSVGSSAPPANTPVDYAAIAKKYNSVGSTPAASASPAPLPTQTLDHNQPGMQPSVTHFDPNEDFSNAQPGLRPAADHFDPLTYAGKGLANAPHAVAQFIEGLGPALDRLASGENQHNLLRPEDVTLKDKVLNPIKRLIAMNNPLPKDEGQGMGNRVAEAGGNMAGQALIGEAAPSAPEALKDTAVAAKESVNSRYLAAREAFETKKAAMAKGGGLSDRVQNAFANNPQGKVMDSAVNLPPIARSGVEDVFRAAAPTGKNVGFRENLNVAAPDLADIARKVDMSEAKGGIISPDMRVRATAQAIDEHLDEMYNTERKPQIDAHAAAPVEVGTSPNALRGLKYLAKTAGDVADITLAKKALEEGTLPLAEADRLAQLANKTLVNYERMTPEAQEALRQTNPRIGGLKALDEDFGININQVLTANGEVGLRSYERRYAALSEIKKQLDSRTNAVELKQEGALGAVGRLTKPLVKLATGGKAEVASASQAAVADVNIGRTLQEGMRKLKISGLSAKPKVSSPGYAVPQ